MIANKKTDSGFRKWFFLFAIFVIPATLCFAFYFFYIRKPMVEHDTSIFVQLPYFGPSELASNGKDTIYHTVPSFSFINQDGKVVTDKDYDDKIYVAEFFFVNCETICPKMSAQLFNIQGKLKYIKNFAILSHTVNPEEDSVSVLKHYANTVHANPNIWNFVTGDKKEIYDIARNGYFIVAGEGDGGPDDFIHSENVVLVDKEKHIRGIYDATNVAEMNRLVDEVKVLVAQYKHKGKQK